MLSSGIYRQFKGSYTPIIYQMQAQAEKGVSSSVSVGVTCEICYCSYQPGEGHELFPASICYRCWLQHIRTFISQISYRVGSEVISPFEGREPIDVCLALKSLLPNDEAELQEFLFKKYCAFTADIEKCPSESCDYVFMMEACRWGKGEAEQCPKCQALLTQAGGFDLKSLVGFVYFLFLTNKCPKCEIPIQKTTGCPHMSCPCGHQFCWYCLKDYYPAANNVYSVHEPRECAAIFISKVIFIGICISGIFLTLLGNEVFQRFMGYFFTGMAYIVHTLLLDLAIALNIFAINSLLVRHYNRSLMTIHRGNKIVIGGIIFCDLVVLLILYWLQLLIESALILLVEASLAGMVALTVWLVMIIIDTWFKYIC